MKSWYLPIPIAVCAIAALCFHLSGCNPSAESGTGEQQAAHRRETRELEDHIMETAKEPFDLTMIVVQAVTEDEKQLKRQLKTGRAGPDAARNLLRTKIGEFDATIAHDRDAAKTIRGIAAPADLNSIEKLHFSQCIKDVAEQLETRSKVNSILRDYAKTGDRRLYNGYLDASRYLSKMEESSRKAQVCELCWHETGQPCSPWEELGK